MRRDATDTAITVNYSIDMGTAQNGVDYAALPGTDQMDYSGSVDFASGVDTVDIVVDPTGSSRQHVCLHL